MRLDTLTVELRPRSSWEAMELGSALVRRHAAAVWVPWLLVTGTCFALLNLAAWALEMPWLAWLLMWWLRPVFDRIPLYVLSRAVFGNVPRVGETLRAQLRWGWRPMLGHLTFRRLSPFRAAMLPVDLLEGGDKARIGERRRVIGGGVGGPAVLLITACSLFLLALELSLLMLAVFLFVPNELLPDLFESLTGQFGKGVPDWAEATFNAADWIAVAFIEPFYIGAGFGLYLNRRTQLEAWDLEIAFRRMRRRLDAMAAPAAAVLLALTLWLPAASPASAQSTRDPDVSCPVTPGQPSGLPATTVPDAAPSDDEYVDYYEQVDEDAPQVATRRLAEIFEDDAVDHRPFAKAMARAYQDPLLRPKLQRTTWQPRQQEERTPDDIEPPGWLGLLSKIAGFLVENLLWLLLGVLVVVLFATRRHWLPWLAAVTAMPAPEPPPVDTTALAQAEPLPPDVATAARRLWAEGQPRRALALLYRASVEAMVARLDAHPPPGATEADCLRLSRRLPEAEDRDAFQRMVRVWQYAAYGHTLPGGDDFEALVGLLAQRFRWSA